ncbi:hypothetical protein AOQ84DRAFT_350568 [Glonium stellatum]|uniref:F-box domain-containing protein n=1 Tax=Glonium stellatum TaxID=574774 RepID=A0A8E2JLV5_9PEZI|nr:hypothetical protein AOQ84DRAFT_350568 [Glonium stellatum]
MSFVLLPAELLIEIFTYLDCVGLKSIRLVCRLFAETSSPTLFERVLVAPRYKALGAFQTISQHPTYQRYVKELIYDGSVYDKGLATNEPVYMGHLERDVASAYRLDSWGRRSRFKKYQQLYNEQEDIRASGILFHTLVRALEVMPNVHSIVYSPGPRNVPIESKDLKDILPRGDPHFTRPNASIEDYASYIERVQHGFHVLIGALGSIKYPGIRSFRVDVPTPNSSLRGTELTDYVFAIPGNQLSAGIHVFSHLQFLTLQIKLIAAGDHMTSDVTVNFVTLRALLRHARQVENVSIYLREWNLDPRRMYGAWFNPDSSIIPIALGSPTWPRLRSLRLGGMHAYAGEVSRLISRHGQTLVELEFAFFSLTSGLWVDIVRTVLQSIRIEKFQLLHVNESMIGNTAFRNMSIDERNDWTYSGIMILNSYGSREFLPTAGSRSVYTHPSDLFLD